MYSCIPFVGMVTNGDDSNTPNPKSGRIQVRIFGAHTPKKTDSDTSFDGIPDEDLPWCTCIMPSLYGGGSTNYGSIPAPKLNKGAWVFGLSLDETYQNNIILGLLCVPQQLSQLATNLSGSNTDNMFPESQQEMLNNLPDDCKNAFFNNILLPIESGDWKSGTMKSSKNPSGAISDQGNVASKTGRAYGYSQLVEGASLDDLASMVSKGKIKINGVDPSLSKEEVASLIKNNANVNIACGQAWYKMCLQKTNGDLRLAGLAYNCGVTGCKDFFKYCSQNTGCGPSAVGVSTLSNEKLEDLYAGFMTSRGYPKEASYFHKINHLMNGQNGAKVKECMEQVKKGTGEGVPPVQGSAEYQSLLSQLQNKSASEAQRILGANYKFHDGAWCADTAYALALLDGRAGNMLAPSQGGSGVIGQINYAKDNGNMDFSSNGGFMVGDCLVSKAGTPYYNKGVGPKSHIVTITGISGNMVTISEGNSGNKFTTTKMTVQQAARKYPGVIRVGKYSTMNKNGNGG